MLQQIKYLRNEHGFAYIKKRLVECDITTMQFRVNEESNMLEPTEYVVKHGDKTDTVKPSDFYSSIAAYKEGESPDLYMGNIGAFFKNLLGPKDEPQYTYVIEGGRGVKKNITIESMALLRAAENTGRYWDAVSPNMPDVTYKSMKDAMQHVDITIEHEDGTTEEQKGIANLIALTPEQGAVVKQLAELVDKAEKMGVAFVHNYQGLFAYNNSELSDIAYDDCEWAGYENIDIQRDEFRVNANFTDICEDSILNVQRK